MLPVLFVGYKNPFIYFQKIDLSVHVKKFEEYIMNLSSCDNAVKDLLNSI